MCISELIAELNEALAEHGDVDVVIPDAKVSWDNEGVDNIFTVLGGIGTITDKLPDVRYSYDQYTLALRDTSPDCKAANSRKTFIALCKYGADQLPICDEFEKPEVHNHLDGHIVYLFPNTDKKYIVLCQDYVRPWPIYDEYELEEEPEEKD